MVVGEDICFFLILDFGPGFVVVAEVFFWGLLAEISW